MATAAKRSFSRCLTAYTRSSNQQACLRNGLTPKTYSEVQRLDETDSEYVGAKLIDLITDQVAFFSTVSDHKNSLQSMLKADITLEDRRCSDELAHRSLPPTEDMDKILRYEERMHRQLDWALERPLERLLATQEARKNAACVSGGFVPPQPA